MFIILGRFHTNKWPKAVMAERREVEEEELEETAEKASPRLHKASRDAPDPEKRPPESLFGLNEARRRTLESRMRAGQMGLPLFHNSRTRPLTSPRAIQVLNI